MTTNDLLELFKRVLEGKADKLDWLALADAYETAGDVETAETLRVGSEPATMKAASRHWIDSIENDADCCSSWHAEAALLVSNLLDHSPLLAVEYAERAEEDD